ncbi:MAG: hypothetical protein KTR15_12195 [Phycisphaeraceae bacterium]|nr:hypothetical protein [Phycisphaeraceae bacterium]
MLRDAYDFCYGVPVADTFTQLGDGPEHWAQDLACALLLKRLPDGSSANRFTDCKKDGPLTATPFTLRAMLSCPEAVIK